MQDYDITLKFLSDRFTGDYVRFILGEEAGLIKKLDKELPLTTKRVDFLAEIMEIDNPFIIHAEFQLSYEKEMAKRMLFYNVRIQEKYNKPVMSVVFYLDEEGYPSSAKDYYEMEVLGRTRLLFDYYVLKVWKLDAEEVMKKELYGLFPLLPLMKRGEELLEKAFEMIEGGPSIPFRNDLYTCTYVMAGIKYPIEFLKAMIKEEIMRHSVTYQEIYEKGIEKGMEKGIEKGMEKGIEKGMEKGIEKGREKGIEKGREKGIAESIFEYVLTKYGFVSDEFRSMVESESNLESLKEILKGLYLGKRPEEFLNKGARS